MADEKQFNILKQGVKAWNQWRKENSEIAPDLSGAFLDSEDLREVNFNNANLSKAQLSLANFFRANLIGANLEGADLQAIDFRDADLSDANLRGTYLGGANLTGAFLYGTDFKEATLNGTIFGSNDLSEAKGLDNVNHGGPSVFGIDTFYQSKGSISKSLLRGAGIPENFITSALPLTAHPESYKCFISFTEADDKFAEKLYKDLKAAGIDDWRWKEDAKWGKTLMRSIDKAVQIYDKVIVVCSEQSLNSPAVIREIERALQKEDSLARQGKDNEVLLPIRLDDYIFDGWEHYRKADVTAKNVGDFRQWEVPEEYEKSLARLIQDLKIEN